MSKIDLHIHSNWSEDAEFSVADILLKCENQGMELVSITDHNRVQSASETAGYNKGMKVISGVELDCEYKGILFHLLGYDFDYTLDDFYQIEKDIYDQEAKTAEEKIDLFRKATGIPIDTAEVLAAAKGGIITGELVGALVLSKDYVLQYPVLKPYLPGGEKSDMPFIHFYWDFFAPGKAAYTPIRNIDLPEAHGLIKRAGGFSILAHPGKTLEGNYGLLDDVLSEGIDGIEVFASYHSAEESALFLEIARRKKVLISAGSDFHGKNKPHIQIGGHGSTLNDEDLKYSLL